MNTKYFIPALLLITLAIALPAQSLTLTKPNGGETLTLAQNTQITWTAANVGQKVRLQLLRMDGSLVGLIASDRDAASGYCSWKIGQYAGGAVPAGQYRIRVSTLDNAFQDESDSPFAIQSPAPAPPGGINIDGSAPPPPPPPPVVIQLLEPSNGQNLLIGATIRIRWISSGLSGSNQVELWQGTHRIGVIVQNQPAYQGDIAWKAGDFAGGTAQPGANFKVRIVNSGGPADFSDKAFALMPGTLTAANNPNQPVQPQKTKPQKQQPQFNAQFAPYAVITSFTVNGQPQLGNTLMDCYRHLGLNCQTSAISQTTPILYRYTIKLENTLNNLRYQVFQSSWSEQRDRFFQLTQNQILTAVYPDNMLDGHSVPIWLIGSVKVEAKNATQSELPQSKRIDIRLFL